MNWKSVEVEKWKCGKVAACVTRDLLLSLYLLVLENKTITEAPISRGNVGTTWSETCFTWPSKNTDTKWNIYKQYLMLSSHITETTLWFQKFSCFCCFGGNAFFSSLPSAVACSDVHDVPLLWKALGHHLTSTTHGAISVQIIAGFPFLSF